MKATVLLLDTEDGIAIRYGTALMNAGFQVETASRGEGALMKLQSGAINCLVLNPGVLPKGTVWISEARRVRPDLVVIVLMGEQQLERAVQAMQHGADTVFAEPVSSNALLGFIRQETSSQRQPVLRRKRIPELLHFGQHPSMTKLRDIAQIAAETDVHILITGPTGTGKGLLARWIAEHGHGHPFVEVNCASLRGELLRSELFGHAKGSFTSASRDRKGLIEEADGGTLFLDEIGDMDLAVQSQFLKTIEDRTFRRLGETQMRSSEFRLISATNSDLAERMRRGAFRRDLYYRICVFPIEMPPLCERRDDLAGLVDFLLKSLRNPPPPINAGAIDLLRTHQWPGNVRELRNHLERACVLSRNGEIREEHFPGILESPGDDLGPVLDAQEMTCA